MVDNCYQQYNEMEGAVGRTEIGTIDFGVVRFITSGCEWCEESDPPRQ